MFQPFEEVYPPLRLPYRGKEYTLPYVSMSDVDRVKAALDPDSSATLDDADLERILLGDALDTMAADGVSLAFKQRAVLTAVAEVQDGRLAAEMIWATGGEPAAVTAWLEQHGGQPADAEPVQEPAA